VKTLAKYLLSLTGLVYVLWGIDLAALVNSFTLFSPWVLIGTQALLLTSTLPTVARLRFLSHNEATPLVAAKAVFIGLATNNILPARLGEIAKAATLRSEAGIPMPRAMSMVFIERFADLNCLLLLGVLAVSMLGTPMMLLPVGTIVGLVWFCLLLLIIRPAWIHLLVRFLAGLMPWDPLGNFLRGTVEALQTALTLRTMLWIGIYSVLAWTLAIIGFAWFLGAGASLDLNRAQILTTILAGVLGIAIPSAPAGIGVYETLVVSVLMLAGVEKSQALAVALALHLLQILLPTVLGCAFMTTLSGTPARRTDHPAS
jgi:uncharacterized membrane protein YbhN (UPF0104 family)